MKLRASARLKLRQQQPKIQLKASSSRSAIPEFDDEDSSHEDESNSMKLSHAFFVVLILHLILIGGIFGFNYIKARQIPSLIHSTKPRTDNSVATAPPRFTTNNAQMQNEESTNKSTIPTGFPGEILPIPPRAGASTPTSPPVPRMAAAPTQPEKPAVPTRPIPGASPNQSLTRGVERKSAQKQQISSGKGIHRTKVKNEGNQKVYTVVQGDNPYSIARRFKVSDAQLMSLNHIQNPTKLQIGTKLKIPPRSN